MGTKSKTLMKSGRVKSLTNSDPEMELVNKYTLEPLSTDDVYLFEVIACDNEIDRDFERFDDASLEKLCELFEGRTVIKDHRREADNQFARVYHCEVQQAAGLTSYGSPLKQLVVRCYTLANEQNEQMISEIKAGIKKEVSISFMPDVVECSICGVDNRKQYCPHYWGKEYDGQMCHFVFKEISDAYELSFVAVPAQRGAGTKKDYALDNDSLDGPPGESKLKKKDDEEEALEKSVFFDAQLRLRMTEAEHKTKFLKGSD